MTSESKDCTALHCTVLNSMSGVHTAVQTVAQTVTHAAVHTAGEGSMNDLTAVAVKTMCGNPGPSL